MTRRRSMLLILSLLALLLAGCTSQADLAEKDSRIAELEGQVAVLDRLSGTQPVLVRALDVLSLLKAKDFAGLSTIVHPDKGVRFTPYPHIDLQQDQVFTAGQVAALASDTTVYTWGSYDGSGDQIALTFSDYYQKFVYDHEFVDAELIGNNQIVSRGNTVDNVQQAYASGRFIEFYFDGFDPQYEGIDWSSLKLVFEQKDGTWYLVGVVHGQWTI